MYRWSVCPGSVKASRGKVRKTSAYAEDGIQMHDIGADCLRKNLQAWEHPDVDAEMAEPLQVYLDDCRADAEPDDVVLIEHKFDLSSVYPGCFGTADFVRWKPRIQLLKVRDLKWGAGIPVEVTDNPQLRYYGLGALVSLKFPAARIDLGIVQPRCNHPAGPVRSETIDAIELLDFRGDLIAYAKKTEDPNAPLVTGDHCRFCPAAPTCVALAARTQEVARLEFAGGLSTYDPAKLKEALDAMDAVQAWVKSVTEFAYAEAERGVAIPGYKLVAKIPRRAWRSEGEAMVTAEAINACDLYKPKALVSPAQAQKLLGKQLYEKHMAPFVIAESSGHVLVPESDKRPPVKVSAALEFSEVPT